MPGTGSQLDRLSGQADESRGQTDASMALNTSETVGFAKARTHLQT